MLKWTFRIAGGIVAMVLVAFGIGTLLFVDWRSQAIAERERDPARRTIETRLGPVEFARFGQGLPVLSIHGTPGGYDQALAVQRAVPERANPGTMTIAASRPGYLGTPLSSGRTFEEQADLHAALLDELGVDRVVVFGASGGGHVALQFALRHPERTIGLLLYAPEVRAAPAGTPDPRTLPPLPVWRMRMIEAGMWLASGPLASRVAPGFDADDPLQRKSLAAMIRTAVPWDRHIEGQRNDLAQRLDPAIDAWPVERIAVPTLILHGNADADSQYEHSRELAARMPQAELVTIEGGDHLMMITRWEELSPQVRRFLDGLKNAAG